VIVAVQTLFFVAQLVLWQIVYPNIVSIYTPVSHGLGFNGPLEYTPYPEPLNVGAQNPGKIYVVYSVIDKKSRLLWTELAGVWQAWGPYEFKAGKGYILEFGSQDRVGMTDRSASVLCRRNRCMAPGRERRLHD